jgi:plasmid stabilization system protein ParE
VLPVSLLGEAADEFDAATDWYEARTPGLGTIFREAVLGVLRSVSENPRRFPRAVREYRRAVVHRFPYSVFFTVEAEGIVVAAVFHGSRHPGQLHDRST